MSNMPTLRVALVTGSSRGIGRGIAIELARAGYSVAINYAGNKSAAEECVKLCQEVAPAGTCFEIVQADISSTADRKRLLEFVLNRFKRLDLLVNNAGVAPAVRADILAGGEESFDRLISINVKGPYFLTQAVANYWIELLRESPGSSSGSTHSDPDRTTSQLQNFHPKIVTVSSISAYTASTNRGDYCISKAALAMLTPLFATRLAEYGINVYEIRPGVIATDMTGAVKEKYDKLIAEGMTPIKRWGTPEDIGRAVAAIADDFFPFSTGEVINVDGGFHLRRL